VDTPRRTPPLPFAAVLLIAYVVAFPNRAGQEIVVRAAWVTPVGLPGRLTSAQGAAHGFRLADAFGYVDPSGGLLRLEAVFHDVAFNDGHYANYSKGSEAVIVRSWDGGIAASIRGSGWPLLANRTPEALMMFAPDLLGLGEYAMDGTLRWDRELGSLITCFAVFPDSADAGPSRCAVGTLDGMVRIIGRDGADLFSVESKGSRIAGSYGCAVSSDGRLVAVFLGLEPQRLVVLDRTGGTYRELWSCDLAVEVRSERVASFSGDSRFLLIESESGVEVREARGRRFWTVAGQGGLFAVATVGNEVVAETRREDGRGELTVVVLPDLVVARAEVGAVAEGGRYLAGYDGYLLHGSGSQISRLDLLRL
jgi:hypothetical protein